MVRALASLVAAAVLLGAGLIFGTSILSTRHAPEKGGALVRVTEEDFKIRAPRTVRAGDVRLSISSKGPVVHELFVVRAPHGGLPLRPDGLTVDEDAIEPATAGVADDVEPGTVREMSVRLTPGRYVLMCNMSGHYLGGMHADLVVQ